jgi:hypothetical protein
VPGARAIGGDMHAHASCRDTSCRARHSGDGGGRMCRHRSARSAARCRDGLLGRDDDVVDASHPESGSIETPAVGIHLSVFGARGGRAPRHDELCLADTARDPRTRGRNAEPHDAPPRLVFASEKRTNAVVLASITRVATRGVLFPKLVVESEGGSLDVGVSRPEAWASHLSRAIAPA